MADIFFVSVEASGDELSVSVIRRLEELHPEVKVDAIGGKGLSRVGITSELDVSVLNVIGLVEVLKLIGLVGRLADQACDLIIASGAKVAVLVDSWGFSVRVAQGLKERAPHIKIIKLVGPQVWASRKGRASKLANLVDHLLCIHEFELPFYEPYGLPCTVIGNPVLGRVVKGDGEAFRERHGVDKDSQCILVLPGSRNSEINLVAPVLANAASELKRRDKNLNCMVLVADSVADRVTSDELNWPAKTLFISDETEKSDIMAAADLALACSGTVTTELATQGCPMIVAYKLNFTTWFMARFFLFKSKYVTLMNIAAGEEIAPELIQTKCTVSNVVRHAQRLLSDPSALEKQTSDQFDALRKMGLGQEPAHHISADVIYGYLNP